MTHIIWILGILILAALPFGCESFENKPVNQQQQEEQEKKEAGKHLDQTRLPERSNNMRR